MTPLRREWETARAEIEGCWRGSEIATLRSQ